MVAIARGIGLNGHGELILIKKVSTAAYSSPGIAGAKSSRSTNWLNVSRLVVTKMARGHFHSEPNRLSGNRLAAKLAVTPWPGSPPRLSAVSGYLDWIEQPG